MNELLRKMQINLVTAPPRPTRVAAIEHIEYRFNSGKASALPVFLHAQLRKHGFMLDEVTPLA